MNTYTITLNGRRGLTVEAEDYDEAALTAARKLYRRKTLTARRVTGDKSMTGWFAAYEPVKTGGWSKFGEGFHVSEDES